MRKDWTGNSIATFITLGASNHSKVERETNDYYATDPHSLEIFLDKLNEDKIYLHKNIWECACGTGELSKELESRGYKVLSTDLIDRGYGEGNVDFLEVSTDKKFPGDIITNPPYSKAQEFVEKALDLVEEEHYVVMYLRIQFLEGIKRRSLYKKSPPRYIYVNVKRQTCYINGDFSEVKGSATCYCWFIWEKGYTGESIVKWIDS